MRIIYMSQITLDIRDSSRIHMIEFSEHFQDLGNDVLMITPTYQRNRSPEYRFHLKQIYLFRKNALTDLIYACISPFLLLYNFIRFHADLVYCRGISKTLIIPFCRLLGIKTFLEINGIIEDELGEKNYRKHLIDMIKLINKINFKLADGIIAVTREIKQRLMKDLDIHGSRIFVVNNGANVDLFKPLDMQLCRQRLGLDHDAFYVGFVGVFAPYHGIERLIDAAAELKKQGCHRIRFLLVGGGDAEFMTKLERIMDQHAVREYFQFTGRVDYPMIPAYINCFDVCIAQYSTFTSVGAGSPLKIFEYLSCGRPVIVSENVGELVRIIVENNAGYSFDQDNRADLPRAIVRAYKERDRLDELGANGRELILREFNWRKNAERIQDILGRFVGFNQNELTDHEY
jgi:glycosyltransferase involved in cell wall biosynthesis